VDSRTHVPTELSAMHWTTTFHVNSRLVKQLRDGRVFLAGDAAHIHSPAGGQGMNTGMQDAVNLAWKLALVHRGVAPLLLDSYERERFPVERGVLRQTDFLIHLVGAHGGMAAVLRDHLAPMVSRLDIVQRTAGRLVSEIAIRYNGSQIVEDHLTRTGPAAGERAPDALARVVTDGRVSRVMQLCARAEHTLLALVDADAHEHAGSDARALCESLVAERIPELLRPCIVPVVVTDVVPEVDAAAIATLTDDPAIRTPRPLRDEYGTTRPVLYLIRPDGYVAFRSALDAGGEVALCRYLERLVQGGAATLPSHLAVPPAC
jgi:3-(3-hydroxy-phenyl)propionate hydroxylase